MDDKLTHYGILGMKWGKRRFQNRDGSLTAAGRKRYEQNQYETPEEFEARKKKAVEGGSAAEVLKFRGKLTNQELQSAKNRIDLEKQLEALEQKKVEAGHNKVKEVLGYVQTGTEAIQKGINLWNVVAQVNNTFRAKQMRTIGGEKKDTSDAGKDLWNDLKSKTAEEILKTMGSSSTEDLRAVNARIQYEDRIKETLFNTGKKT